MRELTITQTDALLRATEKPNQTVVDLGCGEMELADWLTERGRTVVGIDCRRPERKTQATFLQHDLSQGLPEGMGFGPHQIALVSWPINRVTASAPAWEKILPAFETVIYLGKNTDGTMCGNPKLFRHVIDREILAIHGARPQTLTVYGKNPRAAHVRLTLEEVAGILAWEDGTPIFSYDPNPDGVWAATSREDLERETRIFAEA